MTTLQIIIWNHCIEMVNMMKANIPREPLHDSGEFVVATTFHRGSSEVPVLSLCPISIFKLVLNIEKPDTASTSHGHHGNLDDEEWNNPKY